MQDKNNANIVFSCENINKEFSAKNNNIEALQDVTFSVTKGEFVCIVGPSGCGKSTLLRIMAGLIPMTSGDIQFGQNDSKRPRTAMVFQSQGLFPWMNVLDNVAFGLEIQGMDKNTRHQQENYS